MDKDKKEGLMQEKSEIFHAAVKEVIPSWQGKQDTRYDQIRSLSFSYYMIDSLPHEVAMCKNLEEIELINTYIYNWTETFEILRHLPRLKRIKITIPSAYVLPDDMLEKIVWLEIKPYQSDAFFPKVKKGQEVIDLRDKVQLIDTFFKFNDKIFTLPNLEYLSLGSLRIETLPESVGSLKSLKKLDLAYCYLKNLPAQIGELSNLEELSLQFNELEVLPLELNNIESLRVLDLTSNYLQYLPDLSGLSHLKELYLSENQLTTFPEFILNIAGLEILNVSGNYIKSLPEDISQLKSLRIFDASGNKISSLPENFAFQKIEELQEWSEDMPHLELHHQQERCG